jgi:hypothetical protein
MSPLKAFLISTAVFMISGISVLFFLRIFISLLHFFIYSCMLSTFYIKKILAL